VNSIIYSLESEEFPRMRIGIGNDFEKGFMAEYVLSKFTKDEITLLEKPFDDALLMIENFIAGGGKAMLDQNSRK
jgi:PTH1 family peptidyl-tRNA hydrolase